jgi:cell volume regulation protein A
VLPPHPAAKLVRGYQNLFMCWTRETGVIPAALAGLLLGMKAPGAQMIASITFIAILMTILIEAPTTKWLGRKLGLLEENKMYRSS